MKIVQGRRQPQHQEEILRKLQEILPDLQRRYGIRRLGLFGSYAKGTQHRRSDVDILVEFDDRPLTLLQFIALEQELSDLLQLKVDLVEAQTLKPAIGRHILREVIPL